MIPQRPSARARIVAAGGACLVLGILLLVRLAGRDSMAARLADLRSRGLPASVADLENLIQEAPATSRTKVVDAAAALGRTLEEFNSVEIESLVTKPARDWTPADREAAGAAASALAGPTADLHASLADGPVPLGWVQDPRSGQDRYRVFDLIGAQRALALQIRAALASGDVRGAAERSVDQLRLCRSLRPTELIGLLGRLSTESIALPCLGEIAGAAPADPDALPALLRESGDLLSPELEAEAWAGERLTILGMWSTAPERLSPGPRGTRRFAEAAAGLAHRIGGQDRRDRVAYFDYLDTVITAAGRQGPERAAAMARIPPPPKVRNFYGLTQPILGMVIPRPVGLLQKSDSIRFRAEAARTALRVADWRSRSGRWPTSLDEVFPAPGSPGHPVDPGSGTPLRWEATGTGFRIVREGEADGEPDDGEDDRSFAIPVLADPSPAAEP